MRILLAEDNVVNQRLTTRVLNKLGYKDIQIAQTGLEAIEKFNEHFYDVILMDVQMPEMDGLEATRLIRTKQYQQPVIISMTANAMQDDKDKCLAAGMDYYISKPIDVTELVEALTKASESFKAQGSPSEILLAYHFRTVANIHLSQLTDHFWNDTAIQQSIGPQPSQCHWQYIPPEERPSEWYRKFCSIACRILTVAA